MVLKLTDEAGTEIEVERETRVGAIHVSPDAIEFPHLKYKVGLEVVVGDPQLALSYAQVFMQIDTNQQLKALTGAITKLVDALVRPPALAKMPQVTMPTPDVMAKQVGAVIPMLLQTLREAGIPVPDVKVPTPPEAG